MLSFMLNKDTKRYWLYTKDGAEPATAFSTTDRDLLWLKLITLCLDGTLSPAGLRIMSQHMLNNEYNVWEIDPRP